MTSTSANCVCCGKPASVTCDHIGEDGQVSSTHYCSEACRTTDWPAHEAMCDESKHRKHLYRAGKLLQSIFLSFRVVAYDIALLKIVKTGDGKIHLYEGTKRDELSLVEFPVAWLGDDKDRRAAMCYHACDEVLVNMHKMVAKMLEGVATKIDEVIAVVKEDQQRIVFHNINDFKVEGYEVFTQLSPPSQILRIKLKDGKLYALDLAGAQYGQYEPVMPMEDFLRKHTDGVPGTHPLGYASSVRDTEISGQEICMKPSLDKAIAFSLVMRQMRRTVK